MAWSMCHNHRNLDRACLYLFVRQASLLIANPTETAHQILSTILSVPGIFLVLLDKVAVFRVRGCRILRFSPEG